MSTDNAAHLGGLVSGYLIGRYAADRAPVDMREQKRAQAMGWAAGAVLVASFAFMFLFFYQTTHQRPESQQGGSAAYIRRNIDPGFVVREFAVSASRESSAFVFQQDSRDQASNRTTIAVELSGPPRSSAVAIN
jgi:hypothetical protein